MDFANIQAQLANLTSQLSQIAEKTTMQSVPTFGVPYGHGYPTHQRPQFTANGDAWGYQGYDQPSNNMFSNTYNSDWRDHSNYMWGEPQQVQHEGYWQPYEELYSRPAQPPQPPPQSSQPNPGSSMDNDTVIKLLTSLSQGQENQDKKMDELENQIGQIMEFMAQIQEQSELSNSTIENSKEDFEIHDAITLGSAMEVGADLKTSKHSLRVDEELLIEEEEEQPLPQPPNVPTPPHSSKVVPNLIISNFVPPHAPFPGRFMQSTKDEGMKGILDTFPTIHEEKVVEEHLEFIKEEIGVDHTAITFKMPNLAENIPCAFVECAATLEPILQPIGKPPTPIPIPTSINRVLPSSLQAPTQIQFGERVYMDLRTDLYSPPYKDPMLACFEKHFVEDLPKFLLEHVGKPPTQIPNSFLTNVLLMSLIRAPTLEIQPMPVHFKYHLPFNDQFHAVGSIKV